MGKTGLLGKAEHRQLETAARTRGRTLGEWCREVVMENARTPESRRTETDSAAQALMAELVALRAILLNVLFKQANGQALTAEDMQRLIDRADSDKLTKARERLKQA